MYRLFFLVFLLTHFSIAFAQEDFLTVPIKEKSFGQYDVNFIDNDDEAALVFKNKKHLLVYPFISDGKAGDQIRIELTDSFLQSKLLAQSFSKGQYIFYFSTSKNRDFNMIRYDIETQVSTTELVDINMKRKRFLEGFMINNKLYILLLDKREWILNLFEVNGNVVKTFDFNFEDIAMEKAFITPGMVSTVKSYNVIPDKAPVSLNITHQHDKIYYNNDSITFTFENSKKVLIKSINLKTMNLSEQEISHKELEETGSYYRYNSYIHENSIVMGKFNGKQLDVDVKDIKTKKILQSFSVNKKDSIAFASTEIIQEGGGYFASDVRELAKTKQLLRKISNSTLALAITENTKETLQLTLGSFKEINNSGGGFGMPMPIGGGTFSTPGGTISVPVTYSNPYFYGYGNYTMTKSAFFSTVVEKSTLKHEANKEANQSPWERIKKFEDSLGTYTVQSNDNDGNQIFTPKVTTVYKLGNKYLFGYYNPKEKLYHLKSFNLED